MSHAVREFSGGFRRFLPGLWSVGAILGMPRWRGLVQSVGMPRWIGPAVVGRWRLPWFRIVSLGICPVSCLLHSWEGWTQSHWVRFERLSLAPHSKPFGGVVRKRPKWPVFSMALWGCPVGTMVPATVGMPRWLLAVHPSKAGGPTISAGPGSAWCLGGVCLHLARGVALAATAPPFVLVFTCQTPT